MDKAFSTSNWVEARDGINPLHNDTDNVEACLSDLKMRRERDPISRGDREIRREARYTYEDIRYLLELQKESTIRLMNAKC